MIVVKIFLASSIKEFESERRDIKSHISALNDDYQGRGVYFKLIICENLSNAVSTSRKQDEYNAEIRDSQYVYFLIGRSAGSYTREEFDIAWEQLNANAENGILEPSIHTFFLELPKGVEPDESAVQFKEYIDREINHYHSKFRNVDTVKLDLTMELIRNPSVGGELKLRDGTVYINDREGFSLASAPMYKNNSALATRKAELEEVLMRYAELRIAMLENPDDEKVCELFAIAAARRKELSGEIQQIEDSMLETMGLVIEKGRAGSKLNWRERKAIDLVEEGDFESANELLRDAQWDSEVDRADSIGDAVRSKISEYISGKRLLASNLQSMGIDKRSEAEVTELYEKTAALAAKWQVELDVLCEFANFLYKQRHYSKAISVAKECELRYRADESMDEAAYARLYATMGRCLFYVHEHRKAERCLIKAVNLLEGLSDAKPALYQPPLAESYNFLASVYAVMKAYAKRDEYIERARRLGEILYEKDPIAYGRILANSYNRIAIYRNGENQLAEAESYHRMAMYIREGLVAFDAEANESDLSETYNNLGFLLKKMGRLDESEEFYVKCLEIRRRRSSDNPSAFEPKVALTCSNYSTMLRESGRLDESEEVCREALAIRERLAKLDPAYATRGIALTSRQLALTLIAYGEETRFEEAEALLLQSLNILGVLAQKEPEVNAQELAEAESDYALILDRKGDEEEAQRYFDSAVNRLCKYASGYGRKEDKALADIAERYGDYLAKHQKREEALARYHQALDMLAPIAIAQQTPYHESKERVERKIKELRESPQS